MVDLHEEELKRGLSRVVYGFDFSPLSGDGLMEVFRLVKFLGDSILPIDGPMLLVYGVAFQRLVFCLADDEHSDDLVGLMREVRESLLFFLSRSSDPYDRVAITKIDAGKDS